MKINRNVAIAHELQPILFGSKYVDYYNDIESVEFLRDWYGDWAEND